MNNPKILKEIAAANDGNFLEETNAR